MEKPTTDPSDVAPGGGGPHRVPVAAPTVLAYARRPTVDVNPPGSSDPMDAAAGCAVTMVALMSAVGAIALLTAALVRLTSPDADPFGPAFMFCGAVVLAAAAVTCGRATLRENAGDDEPTRPNA